MEFDAYHENERIEVEVSTFATIYSISIIIFIGYILFKVRIIDSRNCIFFFKQRCLIIIENEKILRIFKIFFIRYQ